MKGTILVLKLGFLLLLGLAVSGCITTTTIPLYARSGDQVQISLGGIKRNSDGTSFMPADIAVTITDANSVVHVAKVDGFYRAYPDFTSWYARDSLDRGSIFGDLEPYDGMWWVTIRLTDNSPTPQPLPLAIGPASIAVTSVHLTDTGWENEGTLTDIPIEIVAGTSTVTAEQQYQFQAYFHQRSLTLVPSDLTGVSEVGGFQVTISYNESAVEPDVPVIFPRVVPYSHDPNINIIQHTVVNGDGTRTLTAMITNPNGFVPNADSGGSWAIGKSTFADLRFAVIVRDTTTLANGWESNYWIESADSYYVDLNGDVIGGVTPTLGRSY